MRQIAVLILACATIARGEPFAPTIDPHADGARPIVKVELPESVAGELRGVKIDSVKGARVLRFVRVNESNDEGPAVFGGYELAGNTLTFTPDFALGAGVNFRAILTLPGVAPLHTDYVRPKPVAAAPPKVDWIFPSSDQVPANLLKFYVHFATPMRQTDRIFDQIHILDAAGKLVYDPWRRFQQWSDDGKRLTLWIHPGRVKQGVNLREEFGPVLNAGQKYTLSIDAEVLDLAGQPLGKAFEKAFTATAEDHDRPALGQWKTDAVTAGTRDALVIRFPKPLDRALMERLIRVRTKSGEPFEGCAEADKNETCLRFTPAKPWRSESYEIVADELLEDLAGNTPTRVFDADLEHPDRAPAVLSIPFQPQ